MNDNTSVKPNVKNAFVIAPLQPRDWEQVRGIYLEGIATGHATFETDAPSWEQWDAAHFPFARLAARAGESVIGWAALSRVSNRCVYGGVAEVSIYVGSAYRGSGIGRALLNALIDASERNGIWTLQAGVFTENVASLALHQECGFRLVGRRERIGKMNGVWRDTMLLERRSTVVGIE
jgi:L-amino acid N-acyltransferase YncA